VLKTRLGPVLFGLPPNMKKDIPRLKAFLQLLPRRGKAAFEFRHESWLDEEVVECLRRHGSALCIADTDERPMAQLIGTTNWGYVRLRRKNYTRRSLAKWVTNLRSMAWKEAYVFFKHEDTGTGPKFAARFMELADTGR
jgi:uncharacterized protein YecE (DUF72 family)